MIASALLPSSITAAAPASPDLLYRFHFQRQPVVHLSIESQFDGGPEGFTVLGACLSPWPQLLACGQAVTGVTVRSRISGKLLPLEHPERNIWTCDHRPKEPLVVRYDLAPASDPSAETRGATVSDRYVTFLGDAALLVPEHLVSRPSVAIHYAWDGPLPAGWTAATSFAVADRAKTVDLPLKALLQSVFFWGPAYPEELSRPGKSPFRMVWLKAEPPRRVRETVLSRLAAIRDAVAGYLGPGVDPAVTFFVLPTTAGRVKAMTLTASILLFADPGEIAGMAEESLARTITTAHEVVHTSPAGRITLVDAPVPATFLTEALAEFIGRRALLRAGIIKPNDWASLVSDKLVEYATSSSVAGSPRGSNRDAPYILGDLLVLTMDAEIRRASGGSADILNLVDALLRRARNGNGAGQVSWADFRASLAELTSSAFLAKAEDILRRRQEVRLTGDMFAGCLRLGEAPIWAFDAGFEVQRSIEQRQVVAVRKEGPAWKAGLRDGDALLRWSVRWDRSDVPVSFVVMSQGKRRSVSYLPRGSSILGSRQEVSPATGGIRCEKVL